MTARRPRLLDLYCCQGGASAGYDYIGFEVVGVDIAPQPRYPFEFHQADAIEYLNEHWHEFDAVHASPPCQLYSLTHRISKGEWPDLIGPTRDALEATGLPYVIENVEAARDKLRDPVMLCGGTLGLETYRHRLFESNVPLAELLHFEHATPNTKMGRAPRVGEFMHIVGNFSGVARAREVMNMPWASRDGLREAIPPAYAVVIGQQILDHLEHAGRAARRSGDPS